MKAAFRSKYGAPDVLSIRELPQPVLKANEILVRVHVATVNRTDCGILWARPAIIRLFTGLSRPKLATTGTDFAGQIEDIDQAVSDFKIGDKVWGFNDSGLSSHAQYLSISADGNVLKMPENASFEAAVASAEAAHYALNFVNKLKVAPGQQVLVNGASGGIGSAAVQILIDLGVQVTAVCGTKNVERILALGVKKVIDFEKEDFTRHGETYDFVFDAVGKSTFFKCKRLLKPGGIYLSSELGPWWQNIYLPLITPIFGGKKVVFPIPFNIKASMQYMQKLLEAGKFKPLIDRHYPLEQISEAFEYVASGQKTGNVILKMD